MRLDHAGRAFWVSSALDHSTRAVPASSPARWGRAPSACARRPGRGDATARARTPNRPGPAPAHDAGGPPRRRDGERGGPGLASRGPAPARPGAARPGLSAPKCGRACGGARPSRLAPTAHSLARCAAPAAGVHLGRRRRPSTNAAHRAGGVLLNNDRSAAAPSRWPQDRIPRLLSRRPMGGETSTTPLTALASSASSVDHPAILGWCAAMIRRTATRRARPPAFPSDQPSSVPAPRFRRRSTARMWPLTFGSWRRRWYARREASRWQSLQ